MPKRIYDHISRPRSFLTMDIQRFHETFELGYDGPPRELPPDLEAFRRRFIEEEAREFAEATTEADRLDACVDLVYVILGYCYLRGWDFDEAWCRVHQANMKKVRAKVEADSKRGTRWDVVKPRGWVPPDHSDLVGGPCNHKFVNCQCIKCGLTHEA